MRTDNSANNLVGIIIMILSILNLLMYWLCIYFCACVRLFQERYMRNFSICEESRFSSVAKYFRRRSQRQQNTCTREKGDLDTISVKTTIRLVHYHNIMDPCDRLSDVSIHFPSGSVVHYCFIFPIGGFGGWGFGLFLKVTRTRLARVWRIPFPADVILWRRFIWWSGRVGGGRWGWWRRGCQQAVGNDGQETHNGRETGLHDCHQTGTVTQVGRLDHR